MAIDLEEMRAKLRLDAAGFDAGMAAAQASLGTFRERLATTGEHLQAFGQKLTKIGQGFATKLTLPLVAGGVAAVNWASDFKESSSAVATVFGKAAKDVSGYSGSVAKSLGLSRGEALQAATTFGAMGKQIGLTGKDLSSFSNDSLQAGADLASFYNAPVPEALAAIQSGLQGEAEPLRRFGIFLSDDTLNQYALAKGIGKTTAEMTEQEKIQLRQQYIMEHLGAAQGDFARTSGGLANQLRIVKAQFKDAAAQLGVIMLPLVLKAVQHFSSLIERFNKLSPATKKWVLIAAGIAAAIGPVLLVLGHLATALGAIIAIAPAIGAAVSLMLGPFGLLILAVALLAVAWKKNWFDIRGKTKTALKAILGFLSPFIAKFMKATQSIRKGVAMIVDAFKTGGFKGALQALFGDAGQIILKGLGRILGLPARIIGQFLREVHTGFAPLDAILHNVGAMFQDVGLIIQAIFSGQWAKAFQSGWDLIKRYVTQFMLIGELLLGAFKAIPWGTIWGGLKAALAAVWNAFLGIDWGGVAAAVWNLLVAGFQAIPWDSIGSYILDLSATLLDKGKELFQGFRDGIDEKWKSFVSWLGGRGAAAVSAIGALGATLFDKGKSLLKGLYDGGLKEWGVIKLWIQGLPPLIVSTIGDVASTLYAKGQDLIRGLRNGIGDKWDGVREFFGGLSGKVIGFVGDLSGALYQAGKDLLQGLINGINDMIPGLQTAVDVVNGLINLIDRGHSPWPMMIDAGRDAMSGLVIGLRKGMYGLASTVGTVNGTMNTIGGSAPSSFSYAGMGAVSASGSVGAGGNHFTFGDININGANKGGRELANEIMEHVAREAGLRWGQT